MDIIDALRTGEGRAALSALAQAHGITPAQVDAVLGQVAPALAQRIERNTLSRGGLADIVAELGKPEHGAVLADPVHAVSPAAVEVGNGALDTIFGSKDNRPLVAQAAISSGVTQTIVQKLLPILVSMIMAALAKQTQGGLGDIVKRLPGGAVPSGDQRGPRSPRQESDQDQDEAQDEAQDAGANAPAPVRPSARGGNDGGLGGGLGDVLSKIPGMPGSTGTSGPTAHRSVPAGDAPFGGGSPLPIPGDRIPGVNAPALPRSNPYGNLPDVIRDGSHAVDGNPLGPMVRDVLGSSLGFQSKGILSWIVRLIVLRWGWGLVQRVVQRMLAGR